MTTIPMPSVLYTYAIYAITIKESKGALLNEVTLSGRDRKTGDQRGRSDMVGSFTSDW